MNIEQQQKIQCIIDQIVQKKQNLLKVVTMTLKHHQKHKNQGVIMKNGSKESSQTFSTASKENINSINRPKHQSLQKYSQSSSESMTSFRTIKDLENYDSMRLFKAKLKQLNLREKGHTQKQEQFMKQIETQLNFLQNPGLTEKIKCFCQSLFNDIRFLLKFDINRDQQVFSFMQNKIALELKGPALEQELQLIAYEALVNQRISYEESKSHIDDSITQENLEFRNDNQYHSPRNTKGSNRYDALSTCLISPSSNFSRFVSKDKFKEFIQEKKINEVQMVDKNQRKLDCDRPFNHFAESSQQSQFTFINIKELLQRVSKQIVLSMIVYYGIQASQHGYSLFKNSLNAQDLQQPEDQITSLSLSVNFLKSSLNLGSEGSKKLFPLLMKHYSQKCQDMQSRFETQQTQNFIQFIVLVGIFKGQNIMKKLQQLVARFIQI